MFAKGYLPPLWMVQGIITPHPPEELVTDDGEALLTDDGDVLVADD